MSNAKHKFRKGFLVVLALVVVVGLAAGSFGSVLASQSADDAITSGARFDDSSDDGSVTGSSTSGEVEFYGTVESISANSWVIGVTPVTVNASTFFKGTPQVGALVEVEGHMQADGSLLAWKISVEDSQKSTGDDPSSDDHDSSMSETDDKSGSAIQDDSSYQDSHDDSTGSSYSDDSYDDHHSGDHDEDDDEMHDGGSDHGGESGHESDD